MKKYYSSMKEDPESEEYNPTPRKPRPLYSENEDVNQLRIENHQLKKQVERLDNQLQDLKDETKRPTKEVIADGPVKVSVKEVESPTQLETQGASSLTITHVEPTPKAPSGGITTKDAQERQAAAAKAAPKPKKASKGSKS